MRAAVIDFGQTIVMATHDLVAASFSDHIALMAHGWVVDANLRAKTFR